MIATVFKIIDFTSQKYLLKKLNKAIEPTPQMKSSLSHNNKGLKVMVVDDNAIYRRILVRMLYKYHGNCIETVVDFDNGNSAIERLELEKFDILFMDIDMPVISGLDTVRLIRTSNSLFLNNSRIPIVAVTTNDSLEDIHLYLNSGMDGFIPKPINKSLLDSTLFNILIT